MHKPFLKKRLGQHHLKEGALTEPLVRFLDPVGARVFEVGPGGGVLTAELLRAGARVLACEVDLGWAFELARRFRGQGLRTVALDALCVDWRRLPAPTQVSGNLPFNVATRLVEDLLPHWEVVPRAAFMVQKEVAERMVAGPGDRTYGSLSVVVAAYARAALLGTVKPGSFHPPPKVSAAFVGLELREPPLPAAEMPGFVRLVRLAFAKRRKTLRNSLASGLGKELAGEVLGALGWAERCRAETLGVGEFVELYGAYRARVGRGARCQSTEA